MALTSAGQILLSSCAVFLGAAYWVGRRVSRRAHPGTGTNALVVVIVFVLIALFVPFSYWTGQELYALATKPAYAATVVGYTSEYRDYEEKNSKGRTVSRGRRLMYTAQVRFVGPDGESLELPNSIASGAAPVEGTVLRVVYAPGDRTANELSARSVGLLLGAGVMLFILGYCLWATVWYGLGHPMAGVLAFGMAFLFRFFLPLITVLLELALGYALLKYFVLGNPDHYPLWVACLCTLFTLALLPLLWLLFTPKRGKRK
ncbi:MAG TPA: hypothetical protein VLC92_08005 [Rhodocyclaceae bacterium]|nr:hypothetical protein [Rhodocyclaceae bacterium]